MHRRLVLSLLTLVLTNLYGPQTPTSGQQAIGGGEEQVLTDFDSTIAPIFTSHCLECHSGAKPEGGLSLADEQLAMRGGDSGVAVVRGDVEASLLWQRVASDEMPPSHPISDNDKSKLRNWLAAGATWGQSPIDRFALTTETRAGRDWWALQPLSNPELTSLNSGKPVSDMNQNPIDLFVQAKLTTHGLKPAPTANPRELMRRLYFDLIGLPPTPQQVADFASDPSPSAYDRIVDELLASQQYGERWGRHWLDVVRFGESDGFERNFPRENAWHYRDWVIASLNADMPYDDFVRQQLIGDLMPGGIEGAAATGFWTAGLHNTVVGGSQRMKQLARQDEIEDVLATIGQSFLGLTINCARCHDHKYDPISQTEFYQLSSAISGLGFGERTLTSEPDALLLSQLDEQLQAARSELVAMDQRTRQTIVRERSTLDVQVSKAPQPIPYAFWEFDNDLTDGIGELHGEAHGTVHFESGAITLDGNSFVATKPLPTDVGKKTIEVWVQLLNVEQAGGAAIAIEALDGSAFDAIVFGEREPKQWLAGSNSFVRTDLFDGPSEDEADERPVHMVLVYDADGTIRAYRDGIEYGHAIAKSELHHYKKNETEILFGLRHRPAGGNRFLAAKIYRAAFYDRALSPTEIRFSRDSFAEYVSEEAIVARLDGPQNDRRNALKSTIETLTSKRDQQLKLAKRAMYTLTPAPGETTRVLLRGDPDLAEQVVAPQPLQVFTSLSQGSVLPPDAPEAERRRAMATWITHRDNPLFARVIVNRIWHHHFGTGIVDTPNDFGFNGGRPSHPELLDFLARQLLGADFRLKHLHKLIVTSQSYQQAALELPADSVSAGEAVDADNRLLWRGPIRRLEAEALRDAMLSVSGKMNASAGGPSFKDVSVVENSGTTYYEPIDATGESVWRRTIYRFNPRGGRSALLDTFDCPDPSTATPRRAVTTTPLQALSLLNNTFVLHMADAMADRITREIGNDPLLQIDRAWKLAIAREPTADERQLSEQLVEQHGLPALCRGLFNLNEFVMH